MLNTSAATPGTPVADSVEIAAVERRARRFWVTLIVGFLSVQVIIGFGSVYLALGDPSVAIIPNYHQSALDWDIKHRAEENLRRLGWSVDVNVSSATANLRTIDVRVLDRQGQPVSDLLIEAKVFHHARGSTIYKAQLKETDPGTYWMSTQLTRAGIWQIDLNLVGEQGVASHCIEIEVQ
ncbi:MAG: FixH family protein [Pirellulaceae bacterium]